MTILKKGSENKPKRLLNSESKVKIGERNVQPGDIAVLVRKNKDGQAMKQSLSQQGVPAIVSSADSVFSSQEAEELLTILNAIANPSNLKILRGAWILPLMGGKISDLIDETEEFWEEKQQEMKELHDEWLEDGFYRMFHHLISQHKLKEKLLTSHTGERSITNLLHLGELLSKVATEEGLGIEGLLSDLSRKIDYGGKENEQRLESDADAVKITTIHKSKGLEYPIVFAPFLWKSSKITGKNKGSVSFHKEEAGQMLSFVALDQKILTAEEKTQAEKEKLSESLRLMYVATTRAVHRCYIFWGHIKQQASSALTYIFHDEEYRNNDIYKKRSDEERFENLRTRMSNGKTFRST